MFWNVLLLPSCIKGRKDIWGTSLGCVHPVLEGLQQVTDFHGHQRAPWNYNLQIRKLKKEWQQEIGHTMFIKKLFKSTLIFRNVKLQIYNTLILPTVTHASETRVLRENVISKLMIFERRIMRKMFGPTRTDDGYWRIKTNQEMNKITGQNMIGFIKEWRLNWLGHVERMAEDNNVQKIKRLKPMSKRPIGRPKKLWEDDVLEDIKSMNVRNWKKVVQNRDSWKKVVEQARTLYML